MEVSLENIHEFIESYLKTACRMLGDMAYNKQEFVQFFAESYRGQRTFYEQEEVLGIQIEHHKLQAVDLRFQEPELTIDWREIRRRSNSCIVRVSVDTQIQYRGLRQLTELKNQHHEFRLVEQHKKIKIETYNTINFFGNLKIKKESGRSTRVRNIRKSTKKYRKEEKVTATSSLPKGQYNREQAVNYAYKYALIPNTTKWANYEVYGGDCTNFISQCLYAGGIPFDHDGVDVTEKWYWYSDAYRTPSWSAADLLKKYMLTNTGYGLVARLVDLQEMEVGDVVQLGTLQKTTHSMLVVGVVYSELEPSKIIDLLLAQHSVSEGGRGYNVPLSTKPNERLYYKILGYNPHYT